MKTVWGWLLAALAIAMLVLAFAEVYAPIERTSFGFVVAKSSAPGAAAQVTGLAAGGEAYKQGIRNGDLVDVAAMPLDDRLRLELRHSPPGTTLTVPVIHNGARRIVSIRASIGEAIPSVKYSWPFLLNAIITLLIVAVIALRKPSVATAALVFYGTGVVISGDVAALFSWLPGAWYTAIAVFILAAFSTLPAAALLPFIARFPEVPATAKGRLRVRSADAIFGLSAIACLAQILYEPLIFSSWTTFGILGPFVLLILALLFAALVYHDIAGEARRRVSWVIAGVVVSALAYAGFNMLVLLGGNTTLTTMLSDVSQLLSCALPIALAYAVLRHRVLDINFALNRTLVYGAMTALIVVVVSLVDWLTSRMLSEQRLALAIEVCRHYRAWLHPELAARQDRTAHRSRCFPGKAYRGEAHRVSHWGTRICVVDVGG